VVLIPQPSEDVNDPLRWPTWKKYFAFLNVCLFAFMTTGFISGFSPGLYLLSVEFKRDVSTTTGLILWPLLTSGLGVRIPSPHRPKYSLTKFRRISFGFQLRSTSANGLSSYLRLFCCSAASSGLLSHRASKASWRVVSSQLLLALPPRHWEPPSSM
jgi:hypothetical protein